jgi:hypothetical protein
MRVVVLSSLIGIRICEWRRIPSSVLILAFQPNFS